MRVSTLVLALFAACAVSAAPTAGRSGYNGVDEGPVAEAFEKRTPTAGRSGYNRISESKDSNTLEKRVDE